MYMRTHVTAVVRACFAALRQIQSVRRSLSRHALLTLVRALIVSKVDYCNSVLAGIPGQLQDRLQSVLNAAARLVFSARRSERITPLLRALHWLRVPERVTLWLSILAYGCLRGTAPAYLAESLLRTSNVDTRRRLRSADSAMLVVPCLPSGFGTCVEQPAVICQECTVANDMQSRAEDCTFPVVA